VTKLLLLLATGILLVLGLSGSGAFAAPKETCSSGMSGTHGSVTVVGPCFVGADITINGNLTLNDGSIFAGFGTVTITGNVTVGKGAQLFLGWDADEGELGPDSVGGNVVANQPLSLYIGNVTVHGNLVSNGGGTAARFYNFPIKDNRIDGNLVIHGWNGGWWGVIANSVGGNVDLSNNRSVVQPAGECEGTFPVGCAAAPGAFFDASEVQSRIVPGVINNPQHISGNLICRGNTPAAQINALDGGGPNVVDGNRIGQCAGL
jgi:hypothetical protein